MTEATSIRPSAHPFIRVTGLTREFTARRGWFRPPVTFRAVDEVSFGLERGETLGLVGESGSGKTTLGRCLIRLTEPTAGAILLDGTDVRALAGAALRAFRRRMQIVFQDPTGSLNPRMRVGAAVQEPIEVHGLARGPAARTRVEQLFHEVGLDSTYLDRYPHELSGGQRQRIGIARALSVEPEFLVLDEPVSALDVSVQAQVLNLLVQLKRSRDLTYLFVAHDLAVVRHIADRVAVMYLGRLVETAPAPVVYADPRHPYTRALLSAVPVPDPARGPVRIVLPGDPPSPLSPPAGCPFHPRCFHPLKDARCATERPPLREITPGHRAACHFADRWP